MPRAIFTRDFRYRAARKNLSWTIRASTEPQLVKREIAEAAVRAGVAEIVPRGAGRSEWSDIAEIGPSARPYRKMEP